MRIKSTTHAVNNEKRIIKFDIHCVWITICIQYVNIAYKNVPTTIYILPCKNCIKTLFSELPKIFSLVLCTKNVL